MPLAEGSQRSTETMTRMQQEVRIKESWWMDRDSSTIKVEAVKRREQNRNAERRKKIEVHLAEWVCMGYREKVHEKI